MGNAAPTPRTEEQPHPKLPDAAILSPPVTTQAPPPSSVAASPSRTGGETTAPLMNGALSNHRTASSIWPVRAAGARALPSAPVATPRLPAPGVPRPHRCLGCSEPLRLVIPPAPPAAGGPPPVLATGASPPLLGCWRAANPRDGCRASYRRCGPRSAAFPCQWHDDPTNGGWGASSPPRHRRTPAPAAHGWPPFFLGGCRGSPSTDGWRLWCRNGGWHSVSHPAWWLTCTPAGGSATALPACDCRVPRSRRDLRVHRAPGGSHPQPLFSVWCAWCDANSLGRQRSALPRRLVCRRFVCRALSRRRGC